MGSERKARQLSIEGRDVLSYLYVPGEPPLADLSEANGAPPEAALAVLANLRGWKVATIDVALAKELVDAGCRLLRFSHLYSLDLGDALGNLENMGRKLDTKFASLTFTSMQQHTTSGGNWDALVDVSLAAFPEGHPDAESQDRRLVRGELESLISGSVIGPLVKEASEVALTNASPSARGAGLLIVNEMPGVPPKGGPWVSEVSRDPDATFAGLGSLLLIRAMRRLLAAGRSTLSLVVTDGNPARATYERLGFQFVASAWKVQVPGVAGTPPPTS